MGQNLFYYSINYSCQLFTHSYVNGYLGHFHVLAAVNNTAINMEWRYLFGIVIFVSFSYILKNEIAESCDSRIF